MTDETFRVRDKRGGDRYFIDNFFIRAGYGASVGPFGIAAYNALCVAANADTQECWPSYQTIASQTGMSRRQAIESIATLIDLQIVESERNPYTSNTYTLAHKDHWKALEGSAQDALPSAQGALGVVEGSAQGALVVVHEVHRNKTNLNKTQIEQDEMNNARFSRFLKEAELTLAAQTYQSYVRFLRMVPSSNGTLQVTAQPGPLDVCSSRLVRPLARAAEVAGWKGVEFVAEEA